MANIRDAFNDYISKPLNKEMIKELERLNNIIPEYIILYYDFIVSLSIIVLKYFPGNDSIQTEEAFRDYFNWCWLKNLDNFKKEHIFFQDKDNMYSYFFDYYLNVYFKEDNKTSYLTEIIFLFWKNIFGFGKRRTRLEYNVFLQIYKYFTFS